MGLTRIKGVKVLLKVYNSRVKVILREKEIIVKKRKRLSYIDGRSEVCG